VRQRKYWHWHVFWLPAKVRLRHHTAATYPWLQCNSIPVAGRPANGISNRQRLGEANISAYRGLISIPSSAEGQLSS
jgi:hypothetical protein